MLLEGVFFLSLSLKCDQVKHILMLCVMELRPGQAARAEEGPEALPTVSFEAIFKLPAAVDTASEPEEEKEQGGEEVNN
jgi:hypothetical protein